jgi:hypothetical protein
MLFIKYNKNYQVGDGIGTACSMHGEDCVQDFDRKARRKETIKKTWENNTKIYHREIG